MSWGFLSSVSKVTSGLFFLAACDGSHIDAGHNEPGAHWTFGVSHSFGPCPLSTTPDERTGTWRGEFDDYSLRSGSRSLQIVVEGRSGEGNCGFLTFGDADPIPVPTDPEAWYAPGLPESQWLPYVTSARSKAVEGFAYEFGRGYDQEEKSPVPPHMARLELVLYQPYKAWCNLQPSHLIPRNRGRGPYACLPDHESATRSERFDDQRRELPAECAIDGAPVGCTQMDLCASATICDCGPEGCTVDAFADGAPTLEVLVAFDGDAAEGAVLVHEGVIPMESGLLPIDDGFVTVDGGAPTFHLTRD